MRDKNKRAKLKERGPRTTVQALLVVSVEPLEVESRNTTPSDVQNCGERIKAQACQLCSRWLHFEAYPNMQVSQAAATEDLGFLHDHKKSMASRQSELPALGLS